MNRKKVSIILPCFKRMDYLRYNLWSLSQQKISYNLETIVLNDYLPYNEAKRICKKYQNKLNIKYIFTGKRNTHDKIIRRDQGFVLNIGVKQARGDIIILTGNGLFHLNNTIDLVVNPLMSDKKILSTPKNIFFDDGKIKNYLSKYLTRKIPEKFSFILTKNCRTQYGGRLPYWMAMYKQEFIDIGGHDEDFIGFGGLDDDLINRLKLNGLKYHFCDAIIVHLYHPISSPSPNLWENPKWVYNTFLRFTRRGIIVRNKDREWGKIE